ncbi:lysosomal alpha-mannosidase-like [Haemaphysalis longicornis]
MAAHVQKIYNTTLGTLDKNPSWRYVSAENVFSSRWWNEQSHETKEKVRQLVRSGQLQFVGGGWTQNDEAVTHYTAIIDQMTLGLRFLNDTFGPQCGTPSVAWQADPFGHTATQAALFARGQTYGLDIVMVMSGDDLSFVEGDSRFPWQENLLKLANKLSRSTEPRVHFVHSSPACYIAALHASSRAWPSFKGDLMPYTDHRGRTWTGFYTTRPNLKMMTRYANGFLQAGKQLSVLAGDPRTASDVRKLGEAVATMQHHDAITGTSTEDVAKDYAKMLYQGLISAEGLISKSLTSLLDLGGPAARRDAPLLHFCHLLNESNCSYTESVREFSVVVYNPASLQVFVNVRLPLPYAEEPAFKVTAHGGGVLESQVVPLHRPLNESPYAPSWSLVFQANAPPLGAAVYHVTSTGPTTPGHIARPPDEHATYIENKRYRVHINPHTGLISSIQLRISQVAVRLKHTFATYDFTQKHLSALRPPGAYVFTADRGPEPVAKKVKYSVVKVSHDRR